MIQRLFFLFILTSFSVVAFGQQTKEELQKKQNELKREIDELNKSLSGIKAKGKERLASYTLVKRKIAAREELIQSINKDMRILDDNIYLSQLEINRLRRELDTLKQEYAQSLVYAYKNRSNYDYLNFIFSAATFNDAVKRITYLKSYRQYREQQVDNINKTQTLISNKVTALNNSKTEKNVALQEQGKQLQVLETDRKEQNDVITKLKGQEKTLVSQIAKREKDRKAIQAAIAAAIKREQAIALAEAKKKAEAEAKAKREREEAERKRKADAAANNPSTAGSDKPTTNPKPPVKEENPNEGVVTTRPKTERVYSPFESTDADKETSINFESNRGRLPWPVDAGVVSIPFGDYSIPGTKLVGKSDGITISLPTGSIVKAIADGEVTSVFDLGGEEVVMVRHGKYFTAYSHLASSNVSRGQMVKAGTIVGKAAPNDLGEGEVTFMVTNEKGAPLNPEGWLKRR